MAQVIDHPRTEMPPAPDMAQLVAQAMGWWQVQIEGQQRWLSPAENTLRKSGRGKFVGRPDLPTFQASEMAPEGNHESLRTWCARHGAVNIVDSPMYGQVSVAIHTPTAGAGNHGQTHMAAGDIDRLAEDAPGYSGVEICLLCAAYQMVTHPDYKGIPKDASRWPLPSPGVQQPHQPMPPRGY